MGSGAACHCHPRWCSHTLWALIALATYNFVCCHCLHWASGFPFQKPKWFFFIAGAQCEENDGRRPQGEIQGFQSYFLDWWSNQFWCKSLRPNFFTCSGLEFAQQPCRDLYLQMLELIVCGPTCLVANRFSQEDGTRRFACSSLSKNFRKFTSLVTKLIRWRPVLARDPIITLLITLGFTHSLWKWWKLVTPCMVKVN